MREIRKLWFCQNYEEYLQEHSILSESWHLNWKKKWTELKSTWFHLIFLSGIYTYTYAAEKQEGCVTCSQIPKDLIFSEEARLSDLMEHLSSTYQMKSPGVTTTDDQGRNRTLYLPNVPSIEERTRPNLKKSFKGPISTYSLILK